MNSRYHIDVRVQTLMLIPAALIFPEFVALVLILTLPLAWFFDYKMSVYFFDYLFKMTITPSVCRLEFMLNSFFYADGLDVAYNRRIIIESATYENPIFLGLGDGGDITSLGGLDSQPTEENKQIPLSLNSENQPVYIYTSAEFGFNGGVDYFVKIPQPEAGVIDLARLGETLKSYHLPDKVFQIINY